MESASYVMEIGHAVIEKNNNFFENVWMAKNNETMETEFVLTIFEIFDFFTREIFSVY